MTFFFPVSTVLPIIFVIYVLTGQDFMHVHTFRGHEHRVMALVFVNQEKPLCISADRGGGIYAWEINETLAQKPLKKWYEEKDWRYSGIHALAVSECGCLYTGSGDRLIKAWLLRVRNFPDVLKFKG